MNSSNSRKHPIDNIFTVVLLGFFLIFLLLMILFSTQAYRTAVAGNQENNSRILAE